MEFQIVLHKLITTHSLFICILYVSDHDRGMLIYSYSVHQSIRFPSSLVTLSVQLLI